MQHNATRSFRNALTDTKELTFTTSSITGTKCLSNQVSGYEESALLNPCMMMAGAVRLIGSMSCRAAVLIELLMYAILCGVLIAADLALDNRHYKVPKGLEDITGKLATLASFLLALYVGLGMNRWWRLRTDGVGGIWGANNAIAPLLAIVYQAVNDHSPSEAHKVMYSIQCIRRYSAASLYYFFLKGGQSGFDEAGLLRHGLLTQKELEIMRALPGSQSEYLWSCVASQCGTITKLMSSAKLNPFLVGVYTDQLTKMWMKGRSGAGLVAGQLGCPVIYGYSVLVPLVVRLMIVLMIAVTTGQAVNEHDLDLNKEHFGQNLVTIVTTMIPFLFYVLMLIVLLFVAINANSPFGDEETAFAGYRYVNGLLEDFDILFNVDAKLQKPSMADSRSSDSPIGGPSDSPIGGPSEFRAPLLVGHHRT